MVVVPADEAAEVLVERPVVSPAGEDEDEDVDEAAVDLVAWTLASTQWRTWSSTLDALAWAPRRQRAAAIAVAAVVGVGVAVVEDVGVGRRLQ